MISTSELLDKSTQNMVCKKGLRLNFKVLFVLVEKSRYIFTGFFLACIKSFSIASATSDEATACFYSTSKYIMSLHFLEICTFSRKRSHRKCTTDTVVM